MVFCYPMLLWQQDTMGMRVIFVNGTSLRRRGTSALPDGQPTEPRRTTKRQSRVPDQRLAILSVFYRPGCALGARSVASSGRSAAFLGSAATVAPELSHRACGLAQLVGKQAVCNGKLLWVVCR